MLAKMVLGVRGRGGVALIFLFPERVVRLNTNMEIIVWGEGGWGDVVTSPPPPPPPPPRGCEAQKDTKGT